MEWELTKNILFILFGGFTLVDLIRLLINKGKKEQQQSDNTETGKILISRCDMLEARLTKLEQSTAVNIIKIETELKSLSLAIVDISKDVKQILKAKIWEE